MTAVPLNLAPILREDLFRRVQTAIVTSATLATDKRFDYVEIVRTSEAKSMASTTSMGLGTERILLLDGLAFDDDVAEQLGLLGADLALAAQLEHRQQRDDDLRALPLAAARRRL